MTFATVRSTFVAFNDDKCMRLGAAIAFSTILSIAPLFIVLIAIAGGILGSHTQAQNQLYGFVDNAAGASAGQTVRQIVQASFDKPRQGIIAQTIGWIVFAFGASGLFAALQDALNAIWHVEAVQGGWKQMVRDRLASFSMILVVGFLLLVTFVATGTIAFVGTHFLAYVPFAANPAVLATINAVVDFAIVTVIFALIYKVLPDVDVAWRDVWVGAVVTAVLFLVGEALISLYLAIGGVASAYGAAGSILVALLWIYYSALILLLGAEFTKVNAKGAKTVVASTIRHTSDHPAGVDPRLAGKAS